MAKHLDLEEQEQLDQLKHFWNQYGNLITWAFIAVFGSIAAWNGWQYWQRTQGAQAAVMYDEVERAALAGDMARLERSVSDMQSKFGSTTFAQQAGLLAAKVYAEKGNTDAARKALSEVAAKSGDEGYKSVARLRLAGMMVESKTYDEALKELSGAFPAGFEGLAADRRGDIYVLQNKRTEARSEYEKAYKALDERVDYRRLVEVKLNALGVDPQGTAGKAASVATTAAPASAAAPAAATASAPASAPEVKK